MSFDLTIVKFHAEKLKKYVYIPTFKSLLLVSLRPERQGNIIRSVSSRPNIVSEIKKKMCFRLLKNSK